MARVSEEEHLLLTHGDNEEDYSFYEARSNFFHRFQLACKGNYEIGASVHPNGKCSKGMVTTQLTFSMFYSEVESILC